MACRDSQPGAHIPDRTFLHTAAVAGGFVTIAFGAPRRLG